MNLAAVFLDRDGTIIEDTHYPKNPDEVVLIPSAIEGLKLMREKGYLLFVISNQSGVGRGLIQDHEFKKVHEKVCALLKDSKIEIDGFAFCFHPPEDLCSCRTIRFRTGR
ncbi:MAG: HAD-IIIA family hydrolase [Proteobacteria bacterium]|nr:HAD-IIIA family hydrolase [Pseudomonadota bacterium]